MIAFPYERYLSPLTNTLALAGHAYLDEDEFSSMEIDAVGLCDGTVDLEHPRRDNQVTESVRGITDTVNKQSKLYTQAMKLADNDKTVVST